MPPESCWSYSQGPVGMNGEAVWYVHNRECELIAECYEAEHAALIASSYDLLSACQMILADLELVLMKHWQLDEAKLKKQQQLLREVIDLTRRARPPFPYPPPA